MEDIHTVRIEKALSDLKKLIKLYSEGAPLDGFEDETLSSSSSVCSSVESYPKKRISPKTGKKSPTRSPKSPKHSPERISQQFESFMEKQAKIQKVNDLRQKALFNKWKESARNESLRESQIKDDFSSSPPATKSSDSYNNGNPSFQGGVASSQAVGGAMSSDNEIVQDTKLPRFPSDLLVQAIDAPTPEAFQRTVERIAYEGSPRQKADQIAAKKASLSKERQNKTQPPALSITSDSSKKSNQSSPKSKHNPFVASISSYSSTISHSYSSDPEAEALQEHLEQSPVQLKQSSSPLNSPSDHSDSLSSTASDPEAEALREHLENSPIRQNSSSSYSLSSSSKHSQKSNSSKPKSHNYYSESSDPEAAALEEHFRNTSKAEEQEIEEESQEEEEMKPKAKLEIVQSPPPHIIREEEDLNEKKENLDSYSYSGSSYYDYYDQNQQKQPIKEEIKQEEEEEDPSTEILQKLYERIKFNKESSALSSDNKEEEEKEPIKEKEQIKGHWSEVEEDSSIKEESESDKEKINTESENNDEIEQSPIKATQQTKEEEKETANNQKQEVLNDIKKSLKDLDEDSEDSDISGSDINIDLDALLAKFKDSDEEDEEED